MAGRPDDRASKPDRPRDFGKRLSPRLRAEIFALGARHQGDPLEGAKRELRAYDITLERRALLHEVVRHFAPNEALQWALRPTRSAAPRPATANLRLVYIGLLFVSTAWIGLMLGLNFG